MSIFSRIKSKVSDIKTSISLNLKKTKLSILETAYDTTENVKTLTRNLYTKIYRASDTLEKEIKKTKEGVMGSERVETLPKKKYEKEQKLHYTIEKIKEEIDPEATESEIIHLIHVKSKQKDLTKKEQKMVEYLKDKNMLGS